MRHLFLDIATVMRPLNGMLTSHSVSQWLEDFAVGLGAHPDVLVVLYGEITQRHPHALGVQFLQAMSNRVAAVVGQLGTEHPVLEYLSQHPSVRDFVVLQDSTAQLDDRLQAHLIECSPSDGEHDNALRALQLWRDGLRRPRADVEVSSASDSGHSPVADTSGRLPYRERVVATVKFQIPEFELTHLEGPDDLTLSIGERTPGVKWYELQPGQRVECEIEGFYVTRVRWARLLPDDPAEAPREEGTDGA